MTLTKRVEVVEVTTKPDGQIGYQAKIYVEEDGKYLSHSNHRGVLLPGQAIGDIEILTDADTSLIEVERATHHTREKIKAFRTPMLTDSISRSLKQREIAIAKGDTKLANELAATAERRQKALDAL